MMPVDFEDLLARATSTPADEMESFVASLSDEARDALLATLPSRIDDIPALVGTHVSSALASRRIKLEQLLGAMELAQGDAARLLEAARREWVQGGSHAVYLRVLAAHADREHGVRMALAILEQPTLLEPEIENVVGDVLNLPSGFRAAVHALAEEPTHEAFAALLRFSPPARREERATYALRVLARIDVAADSLFPLAVREALLVQATELAEAGDVTPTSAAACADGDGLAKSRVLGLAARAAAVRGEDFGAVRYLKEARVKGAKDDELAGDLAFVRLHATLELERMLVRAGLASPRTPIYG